MDYLHKVHKMNTHREVCVFVHLSACLSSKLLNRSGQNMVLDTYTKNARTKWFILQNYWYM